MKTPAPSKNSSAHHGVFISADLDAGENGDDDEPEPEEDVDLLVDDVERQHTQCVEFLDSAGSTELVELALGHLAIK